MGFLYSKKGKTLFFLLQNICIGIFIASILAISVYSTIVVQDSYGEYRYNIDLKDLHMEYEESGYFNELLKSQVTDAIRYAVIRNQMETNGSFDSKKMIDVEAYARRYENVEEEIISVSFYMEDLIKWGQYGVEYRNAENEYTTYKNDEKGDKQGLARSFYEDTTQNPTETIRNEGQEALELTPSMDNISDEDAWQMLRKTELPQKYFTEDGWSLIERYKSADGRSITEYVNMGNTYDDLCTYLEETVSSLAYNYAQYKKYNTMFRDNETNLSYFVSLQNEDGTKTIFTNTGQNTDTGAKAVIMNMGKYVCYDATNISYETNTKMQEEEVISQINFYDYTYSGNGQIFVGINTSYFYNDNFAEGYKQYQKIVPQLPYFIMSVAISFLLACFFFILQCIGAGKKTIEGEITLVPFVDTIKLEWLILDCAIFWGGAVAAGSAVWYMVGGLTANRSLCWIGGILSAVAASFLTFLILGLIRRKKSHTLLRNSVCFLCGRGIVNLVKRGKRGIITMYDNGDVMARTWVPYLAFLILNVALAMTLVWGSIGFIGILFAIIIDCLIGFRLFRNNLARDSIIQGIETMREGEVNFQVDMQDMHGENLILAEAVNTLGDGIRKAVETSMRDERLKADLITNVSHDIKTPLTSIINYVNLIKRENIQNEKVQAYIEILDAKSQRLKHLTEDLVEASKISSGNITLIMEEINLIELLHQSFGELSEKFEQKELQIMFNLPVTPVMIVADSRRIWRVIENLGNNIIKYALPGTRVYIDALEIIVEEKSHIVVSMKNISEQPLNIEASELTERFIRGDVSRSTEGSGLGLSIAKNLTEAQGGIFEIYLDGDLFKVILEFAIIE